MLCGRTTETDDGIKGPCIQSIPHPVIKDGMSQIHGGHKYTLSAYPHEAEDGYKWNVIFFTVEDATEDGAE